MPNAEFCIRIARALREHYGFDDGALTWFTMHAELEADHGEEFRKYAARAAEYEDGLDRVRTATLQMAPAVQTVWDGFGTWKEA